MQSFAQNESFASFSNNTLVLDNGMIHREVIVDGGNGQISTSVLRFADDDFNYIDRGPDAYEFRFQVYDMPLSGINRWEFSGWEEIEDAHGGNGAKVTFRGFGIMSVLELELSYLLYPGQPVVRKNITIINNGDRDFPLQGVDVESVTLKSFPTETELYTRYARDKFIGPYEGDWEDPVIALHLPHQARGVVLGNEAPGVLKRIAFYQDGRDFCAGLTHSDQPYPFRKWIPAGGSYTTPDVFLLIYRDANAPFAALNFALPDYVRKCMGLEIFENDYRPVFVYNTWNPFRKNIDASLLEELSDASAECGIREFVIDDGWQLNRYSDTSANVPWWYTQVGDYLVDERKFPGGLGPVFDHIKANGMQPGLWLSIGSASISAEVYRQHPGWFVQDQHENPANLHTPGDTTMRTACMSTDWKEHIREIILGLTKTYGLTYTKLDFASVTSAYVSDPAISGCYATDHPGHRDHAESLITNYQGLFRLFDDLQREAPDLFVDCTFETQGKLHLIDYAFMKHAEGNWLSNIEEPSPVGALRVRHLAWQRTPLFPAASLVIGNMRLDSRDLEFDFFSLLGTFPIMLGDIREVPEKDRRWLKQWSAWMEAMQEAYDYMSYRQDLFGFGEPAEGRWDGWQRINTDTRDGGIVGIFRQGSAASACIVTVQGLDPQRQYEVVDASGDNRSVGIFSGLELGTSGFSVSTGRPYQGKIFEVKGK